MAREPVRRLHRDDERECRELVCVVERIGSARDITGILSHLADSVLQLVRCPAAWVALPAADGSMDLSVAAAVGDVAPPVGTLVRREQPGPSPTGGNGSHVCLVHRVDDDRAPHLVLPLERDGRLVGALCVAERTGEGPYPDHDVHLLKIVCAQAAAAIANADLVALLQHLTDQLQEQISDQTRSLLEANERLRRLYEQAERLATVDGLTGLHNHRYFWQRLSEELARARRFGRQFSVLFMDVDRLKSVNDQHGHLVGDRVLRRVGELVAGATRSCDVAARYGGDEFAVLLIETDGEAAGAVMERMRSHSGVITVPGEKGCEVAISFSLGLATYPTHGTSEWELVHAADQEAYRSKQRHRNDSTLHEDGRQRHASAGDGDN